jgi:hypothetical protein
MLPVSFYLNVANGELIEGSPRMALTGVMSSDVLLYTQQITVNRYDARAYNARGVAWCTGPSMDVLSARADFSDAIDYDPSNACAYYNRAVLGLRQNEDLEPIKSDLKQAIEIDPYWAHPYLAMAAATFRECTYENDPSRKPMLLDKAIADLTTTIRLDPTLHAAHRLRAQLQKIKESPEITEAAPDLITAPGHVHCPCHSEDNKSPHPHELGPAPDSSSPPTQPSGSDIHPAPKPPPVPNHAENQPDPGNQEGAESTPTPDAGAEAGTTTPSTGEAPASSGVEPAEGAPAEGAPAEGAPAEGAPAEGAPAEGAPAEGAPAEPTPTTLPNPPTPPPGAPTPGQNTMPGA